MVSPKRGQDPYPRINWWTGPNPPHRCHSALAVLLWPDWLSGPRGSLQFDNLDLQRLQCNFILLVVFRTLTSVFWHLDICSYSWTFRKGLSIICLDVYVTLWLVTVAMATAEQFNAAAILQAVQQSAQAATAAALALKEANERRTNNFGEASKIVQCPKEFGNQNSTEDQTAWSDFLSPLVNGFSLRIQLMRMTSSRSRSILQLQSCLQRMLWVLLRRSVHESSTASWLVS